MKKSIACLAVIASSSAAMAGDSAAAKKAADRNPAGTNGYSFAGCKPVENIYEGQEAYKNACNVPLQSIQVPAGFGAPPSAVIKVLGCDDKHFLIVSSHPINFLCLPPGAVEL
jgi:hypothetical protein